MGPSVDLKPEDRKIDTESIPVIKPQNIIPAREGQQPKPNQFSNLG